MGRSEPIRVSGVKLKKYRDYLNLSYKRFAKAIQNQRQKNKNIPEPERTGPSPSTVRRMEKKGEASEEVGDDALETLQVLTKEAHEDDTKPHITPDTLPIPTDLYTPIKKEIELQKKARNQKETFRIVAQQQHGQNGFLFTKKHLTLYEALFELDQTIRNSDTLKTLYVSIRFGWYFKALMAGLADMRKTNIDRIVVRGITLNEEDNESKWSKDKKKEKKSEQMIILMSIYATLCGGECPDMDYYEWEEIPEFHGFMYGEDILYVGRLKTGVIGLEPDIIPMYRITHKDKEKYTLYKRMMMHGSSRKNSKSVKKEPRFAFRNYGLKNSFQVISGGIALFEITL